MPLILICIIIIHISDFSNFLILRLRLRLILRLVLSSLSVVETEVVVLLPLLHFVVLELVLMFLLLPDGCGLSGPRSAEGGAASIPLKTTRKSVRVVRRNLGGTRDKLIPEEISCV